MFDALMFIITVLSFPFLFVYVAGTELFKKAVYVVGSFLAALFGLFFFTTGLIALFGDSKEALKQAVDFATNVKGAVFIETPQKIPVWTNTFINYLHMHPFVRNLLIMWLIGFLIQQFFGLLGRYSYSAYAYRVRRMSSNQQNEPPQEVDPTDGFTKAHFDAYFPEGWQERRQNFFNQVKEAKEEIQRRIKKR
ncbi:hypothetical protein SAMN04324257_00223 [Thermoanaerobacter thermohydrosulfuricus]|nr:hypothetical protein SAMN04324257_00223 [Thermoanaerobacter thermohydrosulfuricus]